MTTIKLTNAAKHYEQLPHQIAAWNALEGQLTPQQLSDFAELYRAAPAAKPGLSGGNSWDGLVAAGRAAGAKYPELVAAQWALESGWGKHLSGKNNYFGLKGDGTSKPTQEFISGKWVTITDSFIDFPDLQSCVQYLVDRWYKDYKSYKGVNRASSRNAAAQMLISEGYATDPAYTQKLIKLMDQQAPSVARPSAFTPGSPFSFRLTPSITYGELALQSESRRFKHQYQCDTALFLCQFAQKARDYFKSPIIITSGYRPPAINLSVGGSSQSEHLYNAPDKGAIDWYLDGVSVYTLQKWCDERWPYSLGYGAPKGFIHQGVRPGKPKVRWDY